MFRWLLFAAAVLIGSFAVQPADAQNRRPENSCAYFGHRGMTEADQHQWKAALADFNRALKYDPNCAEGYLGRGLASFMLTNSSDKLTVADARVMRQAADDFSKFIELPSDGIDHEFRLRGAYLFRGGIYLYYHHYDEALADCSAALRLDPADDKARLCRDKAAQNLGK